MGGARRRGVRCSFVAAIPLHLEPSNEGATVTRNVPTSFSYTEPTTRAPSRRLQGRTVQKVACRTPRAGRFGRSGHRNQERTGHVFLVGSLRLVDCFDRSERRSVHGEVVREWLVDNLGNRT